MPFRVQTDLHPFIKGVVTIFLIQNGVLFGIQNGSCNTNLVLKNGMECHKNRIINIKNGHNSQ